MKVKSGQKGFTLVEMLVVMAVGGMLLSGLVTAIFQTVNITAGSSTQITALEDIRNVARRITTDVKMAVKTPNLSDGAQPVNSLVLDWTSWYDNDPLSRTYQELSPKDHRYKYTLSEGKVQREYWTGDHDEEYLWSAYYQEYWQEYWKDAQATEITTVARYISDIGFSLEDQIILVTITASPEGKPETAEQKTYHMYLQPKEEPVQ